MSCQRLWCISNAAQGKQRPPSHLAERKGKRTGQAPLWRAGPIILKGPADRGLPHTYETKTAALKPFGFRHVLTNDGSLIEFTCSDVCQSFIVISGRLISLSQELYTETPRLQARRVWEEAKRLGLCSSGTETNPSKSQRRSSNFLL